MANANDFFSLRFVTELGGVAMSNLYWYQIDSILGADTDATVLTDLATQWWDTFKAAITDQATFSCAVLNNITTPRKTVVFPSLAGGTVEDSHPQYSVVRINTYAKDPIDPASVVRRGATNISGVIESLSRRGRLNDLAPFANLRTFLYQQQTSGVAGWQVTPHLRYAIPPGPATYNYWPMEWAQINTRIFTLRSRKTKLCS